MFNNSNKQICIYEGTKVRGKQEIGHMGISSDSVLGTVVLHTAGICIDNWIRIIGQKSKEHNGISEYNLDETKEECIIRKGMLIVAQDIVCGIFAINMSKFKDGIEQVWYFAPDTLEWECLDMDYTTFIAWAVQGNTDEFYYSMRWNSWKEDCSNINFEKAYLIYPFLWSNECDLDSATKRVVPFRELMELNIDYAKKLL